MRYPLGGLTLMTIQGSGGHAALPYLWDSGTVFPCHGGALQDACISAACARSVTALSHRKRVSTTKPKALKIATAMTGLQMRC